MLVGWAILSPLSKYTGWAPGAVGSMTDGARGWILWVALAIMCADSVVSLAPVVYGYMMDFISTGHREKDDKEVETPERLVPMSWVFLGWTASVLVGTFLVWLVFGHQGIKPWATLIGFVMGGMLSILA